MEQKQKFGRYLSRVLAELEARPAAGLTHALTIASLERAAAGADCDRITLHDSILAADSATGELQRTAAFVRELRTRREGSVVVGC